MNQNTLFITQNTLFVNQMRVKTIFTFIFGNSRLFTHVSQNPCIREKYTKYTIAKMKFSIWRHGVCEICKNIGSICPFMASRVADTIYTPS